MQRPAEPTANDDGEQRLMKHAFALLAAASLAVTIEARAQQPPPQAAAQPPPPPRPRVIVTTDGEIDDRDSMIRFLLYANEFDVEALIYNSSRFHWLGNA